MWSAIKHMRRRQSEEEEAIAHWAKTRRLGSPHLPAQKASPTVPHHTTHINKQAAEGSGS